jgi:hypothetical protein
MSDDNTLIPVSKDRRQDLRQYKAKHGDTYDEAIERLLTESGWSDE